MVARVPRDARVVDKDVQMPPAAGGLGQRAAALPIGDRGLHDLHISARSAAEVCGLFGLGGRTGVVHDHICAALRQFHGNCTAQPGGRPRNQRAAPLQILDLLHLVPPCHLLWSRITIRLHGNKRNSSREVHR